MAQGRYHEGDSIVLKTGVLGSAQPAGAGRIMSILPAAQGFVHYRVRFQNENFERSIRQDDIDIIASPSSISSSGPQTVSESSKSSWINSNAIRIRK